MQNENEWAWVDVNGAANGRRSKTVEPAAFFRILTRLAKQKTVKGINLMKISPNCVPFILLAVVAGAVAVTGCKKKTPPPVVNPPAADATPAAAGRPAEAPAPAAAPADAGSSPAVVSVIPLKDPGAFQSSDPKLQALWNSAIAAAQTNGWYATYVDLKLLRGQQGLDNAQTKCLDTAVDRVGKAMYNAANQGDAAALQAFANFRRNRGLAQ